MSNVLIVSDSHGLTNRLVEIANRHEADVKIHCGDSELAHEADSLNEFITVRGNCDWERAFPETEIVELNGLRIFATHGHLFGVKSSLLQLQYRAKEVEADIVLFGHSHVAYCAQHENQLFINPGSIRTPRKWPIATYCIVSWENRNKITVTFYDVSGKEVTDLPFQNTFHLS